MEREKSGVKTNFASFLTKPNMLSCRNIKNNQLRETFDFLDLQKKNNSLTKETMFWKAFIIWDMGCESMTQVTWQPDLAAVETEEKWEKSSAMGS